MSKKNQILENKQVDAFIVSDGYNMRYLSGFAGETGFLYLSPTKQVVLTDFRYTEQATNEAPDFTIMQVENNDYYEVLLQLIKEDHAVRIGFENESISYTNYANFNKYLENVELIPLDHALDKLRVVKTEEELAYLSKAEAIGDIAFSKIIEIIKPGMTELEVAAQIEFLLKTNGAEQLSFPSIVCSGVNTSMPHAVPTDKKIENGDFVTMDFGCKYHGYCSDMTRTIVVGKASEKQKKVYQTVLSAQLAALEAVRAGLQGKVIDKVARDIIYNAGYEGCFGHGLGHSVGLFIHENPRLSILEEAIIPANCIETVEPGIYIPGFGGVRIEDMVCVTEDGHINYAHSDKKLIEL